MSSFSLLSGATVCEKGGREEGQEEGEGEVFATVDLKESRLKGDTGKRHNSKEARRVERIEGRTGWGGR